MRLLWFGVLITGFLLLAVPTYERYEVPSQKRDSRGSARAEDGTGFPQPYPTPSPSPSPSPKPGPKK
jgi:hypothetical protein